jgi:hypothetical protein
MKYLRKIFESKENSLITKDFALDFQDIFLEIEDYSNLVIIKSYYDIDLEEWKNIDSFDELSFDVDSISFYVSQPLPHRGRREPMSDILLSDIIYCIKRAVDNSFLNLGYTITYRELYMGNVTNDKEISIDEIDKLVNKNIISISFTNYNNQS